MKSGRQARAPPAHCRELSGITLPRARPAPAPGAASSISPAPETAFPHPAGEETRAYSGRVAPVPSQHVSFLVAGCPPWPPDSAYNCVWGRGRVSAGMGCLVHPPPIRPAQHTGQQMRGDPSCSLHPRHASSHTHALPGRVPPSLSLVLSPPSSGTRGLHSTPGPTNPSSLASITAVILGELSTGLTPAPPYWRLGSKARTLTPITSSVPAQESHSANIRPITLSSFLLAHTTAPAPPTRALAQEVGKGSAW